MHLFRYERYEQRESDERLKGAWLTTGLLIEALQGRDAMQAYCYACDSVQSMAVLGLDWDSVREGIACPGCGLSARLRTTMQVLDILVDRDSDIYITEQCTPLYLRMQSRYPRLRGSEFQPDAGRRAKLTAALAAMGGHGEVEHQDVMALTMTDASFDIVVSLDVLEHLPEPQPAFLEFARVLRPGGLLLATFPFTDVPASLIRASLTDGEIVHHHPPEYHGDPIGAGVLCFRHFGWDVLGLARDAGFAHCSMIMAWAPEAGVFYGHWLLVARKDGNDTQENA